MTNIEYCGYNFLQSAGSDRYHIQNSRGVVVERGYEKPNMSISDAITVIERYILVNEIANRLIA